MGRKGKQAKHAPLSAELLGFKSAVETRNVFDSNSVLRSEEVSFCANNCTSFRFLNSQIIKEIGVRQPKEKIIQWLKEREFFFIDFNLMCVREDNKSHRFYYPCELGLVKYSMIDGIIDEFHTFIDCGDIPDGYFREAYQNETNHRIPVTDRIGLQQLCSHSNDKINEKLIQLITKNEKTLTKEKKFVCFNVADKITQTYGGYEWLDSQFQSKNSFKLPEISTLSVYELIYEIAHFMDIKELKDNTRLHHEFNTTAYDFENGICCAHHNEVDCNNCAIANCRRMACVVSSLMSLCFSDIKPIYSTERRIEREDEAIVKVFKFKEPGSSDEIGSSNNESRQLPSYDSMPPGFTTGSAKNQLNVTKDERRVGRRVKTVPPGFEGSVKRRVNVDSVIDALRKTNI